MKLIVKEEISIPTEKVTLQGTLIIPENAKGIVLFAHGSGSGRFSPRNQFVASQLHEGSIGTLLMDLLTPEEEAIDDYTREYRFDIPMLAKRLAETTEWLSTYKPTKGFSMGYFGSSTGAAAALIAAAEKQTLISAVVSRGGRPDLAEKYLQKVQAPTLLIVGGDDTVVIELNQFAYDRLKCEKKMEIVPGATHLFEEPGTLEQVARLARNWFSKTLNAKR